MHLSRYVQAEDYDVKSSSTKFEKIDLTGHMSTRTVGRVIFV